MKCKNGEQIRLDKKPIDQFRAYLLELKISASLKGLERLTP
ncbi:MAG: hypothetical protein OEL84_09205 [Nitrosopumilus sp.]|nr:hypothetical protein [Nitrosopumilus sp.]